MPELSFDDEQLAAGLGNVVFTSDDVLNACLQAETDGAAEVGFFPAQGQAQYQVHPVLRFRPDGLVLHVIVFNDGFKPNEAGYYPDFTVVLITRDGEVLFSRRESYASPAGAPLEVIPLERASQLISACLEWVG